MQCVGWSYVIRKLGDLAIVQDFRDLIDAANDVDEFCEKCALAGYRHVSKQRAEVWFFIPPPPGGTYGKVLLRLSSASATVRDCKELAA